MTIAIQRLSTVDADFAAKLKTLLAFEAAADDTIERTVATILADVKTRGDAAVVDYSNRFDRLSAASMADLELSRDELEKALTGLPTERRAALEAAAQRVRAYHEKQKLDGLKNFVKAKADGMAYTVAYDSDRSMSKAWMEPAGKTGIPCAFVVGGDGKIAWIGHPGGLNQELLTSILAGTFDAAAAAKAAEKEEAAGKYFSEHVAPFLQKKDFAGAIGALDLNRRHIRRAREVACDRIEERVDADVV